MGIGKSQTKRKEYCNAWGNKNMVSKHRWENMQNRGETKTKQTLDTLQNTATTSNIFRHTAKYVKKTYSRSQYENLINNIKSNITLNGI